MFDLRAARRSALIGYGLAALLLTAACGGDSSESVSANCTPQFKFPTLEEGELNVAAPEYPPLFSYQGEKVSGVDGEILKEFAKDACLELEIHLLPAAGVIESVKSNRADIAAGGWYITPQRGKIIGQTKPAYSDPPVLVAEEPVSEIEELKGQTIGTTSGYLWVQDLQQFAGENAKLYESPDAVFADLVNGRIDAGLMAVNEAGYRLGKAPDSGLTSQILESTPAIAASQRPPVTNFPHTKENAQLEAALNEELAALRKSGELARILAAEGIDKSAANPMS